MGKSSAAPAAPDYAGAAKATAAGDLEAAKYATAANRVDQYTPYGSLTYTSTGGKQFNQAGYDAALKNYNTQLDTYNKQLATPKTPTNWFDNSYFPAPAPTAPAMPDATSFYTEGPEKWTQTTALDPKIQAALDSQLNIQQNQSGLANTLQGQVAKTMGQPLTTPDIKSYINGVPKTETNFGNFNASGVGGVDQRSLNPQMFTLGSQPVNQNLRTDANAVDQQFDSSSQGLDQNLRTGARDVNQAFGTSAQNLNQNFGANSQAQGLDQNLRTGARDVNQAFGSNAQSLNQNFGSSSRVAQSSGAYTRAAGAVDLNAPQFSDANAQQGAQAAYKASTSLLQPQWDQENKNLDTQLRLQGLTPGTEAYNNASQNQQRVQSQTLSQMANQAVVTGNGMANQNYASALAGYGARNTAQGQAFGQGQQTFTADNTAAAQQFGQDLSGFAANNTARQAQFGQDATAFDLGNQAQNQAYTQGANTFSLNNAARTAQYNNELSGFNANNTARQAQFGQDATAFDLGNQAQNQAYTQGANTFSLNNAARDAQYNNELSGFNASNAAQNQAYTQGANTFGMNNDARTQSLQNGLAQYQAMLQGQNAYNTAQGQAYGQSLAGFGANQQAIQNQNAAQQQAYGQQMNNYQTAYSQAMNNYLQPLNSMNAVLTGQQVQSPTFSGYATQNQTKGADMLGASQLTGQWNQNAYNQQTAQNNSTMGTLGSLASVAAMMFMSDVRLKTNIRKIGITEGGTNWYAWDWKDGSGSSRGVLAQEIALTIPHAVVRNAANDYLMVNYAAIR